MKIIEINDNDVYGKVFNGYDIMESFNSRGNYKVKQIVNNKYSNNENVKGLFRGKLPLDYEEKIHKLEREILSTHSLISIATSCLKRNKYLINSDLIHLHQVHNSHHNLSQLLRVVQNKPTVISFHDPWFMTGRCVHPGSCKKWQEGCKQCNHLETLFDFSVDNCNELWKIKQNFIKNADAEIIVSSKFMYDMIKLNPYTKDVNVHILPFGIDVNKYKYQLTKEQAKIKLNINPDHTVIFFRASEEKGVKYIVESLKKIKNKKEIVLLTCSQNGLLKEIENDFNIIEMGYIKEEKILECYNASDIFLMPSLGESFGMMAIEAMASNLPVVIFDNTALPHVTDAPKVGILVKDRDSDDLYEKIEMLINDKEERIKRGRLGRELVLEKYSIEKYEDSLEKIYQSAYNRQKYKLKIKKSTKTEIDYSNQNVQTLLLKLKEIYETLFNDGLPKIFTKINTNIKPCEKIKFSDKNVENLIIEFNEILYKKIKSLQTQNFDLKESYAYDCLKNSKLARKIYNKLKIIKNSRKKVLLYEIRQLQEQIKNMENLKKNYLSESINISNLNKRVISLENNINLITDSYNSIFNSIKYKIWNFNNSLNLLLYQEYISKATINKNYKPKVSIIIPVYNGEDYIIEAIDSALAQTYKNIEIIVINDGSNDKTASLVESYSKKIKYYKKENGGVSSALNYGIKKMTGDYFIWLSHDDLIDSNHVEKLIEFISIKENKNKIPYASFKIIDEDGKIKINETIDVQLNCFDYKTSVTKNYNTLLQGEINGGSVLIPKTAFLEVGLFDENLKISQERDMWSRLIKKYEFINIPYDTSSIRQHGKQVSSKKEMVAKESNQKNLEIINNLEIDEILKIESNIEIFYEKLITFYKLNSNYYMAEELKKIKEKMED